MNIFLIFNNELDIKLKFQQYMLLYSEVTFLPSINIPGGHDYM